MSRRNRILVLLAVIVIIDVFAFFVVPPYDPTATDGSGDCVYPVCFINGNLELPAPHVVFPPGHTSPPGLVIFDISISSTLFTLWIVAAFVVFVFWFLARDASLVPNRRQNLGEWIFETLESFGMSLGGPEAKPYIPLFAAFFLLILCCNWSGLVPGVGRVYWLRAPTSDVNVTIGLALVAFGFFEYQGFRKLGVGRYLGKFFPLGEFRHGFANGVIAMFVGLIELLLEFVKPVTLSMRLFGNIYGGEVALGVITALTIALIPLGLYALEVMLNLVQALIFSTLTLMFTLAAIEQHGDEHDESREPTATPADPDLIVAGSH